MKPQTKIEQLNMCLSLIVSLPAELPIGGREACCDRIAEFLVDERISIDGLSVPEKLAALKLVVRKAYKKPGKTLAWIELNFNPSSSETLEVFSRLQQLHLGQLTGVIAGHPLERILTAMKVQKEMCL